MKKENILILKKISTLIQQKLPLKHFKVKWRYSKYSNDFGYCYQKDDNTFIITVAINEGVHLAIDGIIHEYAHALDMEYQHLKNKEDPEDHTGHWGACYARVYRTYLKILGNKRLTDLV